MDSNMQQLVEDLRARAMTYTFLARALSEEQVDAAFLTSLAASELQTGTELDAYASGLAQMTPEQIEEQRAELAADHASCLLGMSPDPVTPFESVYTSDKRLMMQQARDEVVKAYAQAGFVKDDAYRMPEDHVSLELDFLAGLVNRLADALERTASEGITEDERELEMHESQAALDAQVDFLTEHALVWMPSLCNDLEMHASTPFYRGVAQMLRVFLEDERAYLEELDEEKGEA